MSFLALFAEDLDHHPLAALAVPLAVEDPLPGAEIQLTGGDGDDYLVANRQASQVRCRAAARITEGMVLVSAMHISASVFVNDHEPNLWGDILKWLEERIAPWSPDRYRHNSGTGEDNAAAHLRSITIGHEVIVPVTGGELDLGPWQRVFYGEWDGQRPKRVLFKAMGD